MKQFNRIALIEIKNNELIKVFKNLRIIFLIEKDTSSAINKSKTIIYNLSENSRRQLENIDTGITIKAGYENESFSEILFSGQITRSIVEFKVPEILSTVESGDGMIALRESRSNISQAAGVSVNTILKKLAADLQLTIKEITSEIKESFSNGFSFIGKTKDALDTITDSFGLEWSIQDGEIQINNIKKPTTESKVLISAKSGLLSSPEPVNNDSKILKGIRINQNRFKVKTLLNPKIRPGGLVEIQSKSVNGEFKVRGVQHSGDTHGDDWTSVCEVIKL